MEILAGHSLLRAGAAVSVFDAGSAWRGRADGAGSPEPSGPRALAVGRLGESGCGVADGVAGSSAGIPPGGGRCGLWPDAEEPGSI